MNFGFRKPKDKKTLGYLLPVLAAGTLLLGACGLIDQAVSGEAEVAPAEITEDTVTVTKTSSTAEVTQENGPFNVTLKDAEITQIPPEDTLARDLIRLSIFIELTNESEALNTIHPNQARIQTDTGQEVMADQTLSDQVGGDFTANETKQGELIFIFSGEIEDASTIYCSIDTGYDFEYNWLGENLEFVFEF